MTSNSDDFYFSDTFSTLKTTFTLVAGSVVASEKPVRDTRGIRKKLGQQRQKKKSILLLDVWLNQVNC